MAIRFDDLLNGSAGSPTYENPVASVLPTAPKDGPVDSAAIGARTSSPRAVLLAWLILTALLIAAHVLTLSVQR